MKTNTYREPFCIKKAAAGGRVVTRDWHDVTNVTLLEGADSEGLCVAGVIHGRVYLWFKDGRVHQHKSQHSTMDLFIARDMQVVGDNMIPAGMSEAPSLGSTYYTLSSAQRDLVSKLVWWGDCTDNTLLERGFAFNTYKDAQEAAAILFDLEKVTTEHGGHDWKRRGM